MGLLDYFRRRRQRESAIPDLKPDPLGASDAGPDPTAESIAAAIRQANSERPQSVPSAIHDAFRYATAAKSGGVVEGLDYRKLRQLQASVLAIMKEHGLDPQRPDPSGFTSPELQRALRDAVAEHGFDSGR